MARDPGIEAKGRFAKRKSKEENSMESEKLRKAREVTKEGVEAAAEALRARRERTDAAVEAIQKLPDEVTAKADGGSDEDYKCAVDLLH